MKCRYMDKSIKKYITGNTHEWNLKNHKYKVINKW